MLIRECKCDDLPKLMAYIDHHWKKNHILAQSKTVLDWYYGVMQGYNFLIAIKNDEIFGILGYIDSNRFYSSSEFSSELWLALWSVRDDSGVPGLGLRLILELKKRYPKRSVAVLGLSEEASKIYKLLRYKVKKLDHFFVYNTRIDHYQLLQGALPSYQYAPFLGRVCLIQEEGSLHLDTHYIDDSRHRGPDYFINRYLRNPFHTYQLFRIQLGSKVGYAVARVMRFQGSAALRLVDFYGCLSLLGKALSWFVTHLHEKNYEYMDLYIWSDLNYLLSNSGFINRNDCADDVIVPNYFEPFIAKNVDLYCALENGFSGPVFKADGDQERPNQVSYVM